LSVQFVSKISNLCDHNPPTIQTDRQTDRRTDGRTTCDRSASRGKNVRLIELRSKLATKFFKLLGLYLVFYSTETCQK